MKKVKYLPAMEALVEVNGVLPGNHLLLPSLRLLHHSQPPITNLPAQHNQKFTLDRTNKLNRFEFPERASEERYLRVWEGFRQRPTLNRRRRR